LRAVPRRRPTDHDYEQQGDIARQRQLTFATGFAPHRELPRCNVGQPCDSRPPRREELSDDAGLLVVWPPAPASNLRANLYTATWPPIFRYVLDQMCKPIQLPIGSGWLQIWPDPD